MIRMQAPIGFGIALMTLSVIGGTDRALCADAALYSIGLAQAKITPEVPIRMAGYASRNKPSEGVLADLYAKALVIQDDHDEQALLLTVDVIGFNRAVADYICGRIGERAGFARRQIMLCPSHTHTGPIIGLPKATTYEIPDDQAKVVHEYCFRLAETLARLAAEAKADLQPAKLSWGVGLATYVMNRREATAQGVRLGFNPSGYADRSVPVLRVDDADGKLRAVIFGCACHNTTLTGEHYVLSGDYAGFAQQHIQAEHPGVQAMFMIGCAGSANPYPRGTEVAAREHGQNLGAEVCRVLESKLAFLSGALTVLYDTAALPLQPVPTRERLEEMAKGPSYVAYNAQKMLAAMTQSNPLPEHYDAPIAVWQFGEDLTLVSLSGEVVNDYVPLLQNALGPRKLWISAYANDCYGYLPTARMLTEGGYETRCLYTEPGFFTPEAEPILVDKVRAMAAKAGREISQ